MLAAVQKEIHRIVVKGYGPPVFAFDSDPEGSRLADVTLAVNVGPDAKKGVRHIVRLGSFWLAPELLARLQAIHGLMLNGCVAPLLYAIREFSTDEEWVDPSKGLEDT